MARGSSPPCGERMGEGCPTRSLRGETPPQPLPTRGRGSALRRTSKACPIMPEAERDAANTGLSPIKGTAAGAGAYDPRPAAPQPLSSGLGKGRGRQRGSDVRGRQRKEAAAARRIGLSRGLEDAVAMRVEGDQKLVFGSRRRPVHAREGVFPNQKRHFARIIMSPKADTTMPSVVTAAPIGEIDRHPHCRQDAPSRGGAQASVRLQLLVTFVSKFSGTSISAIAASMRCSRATRLSKPFSDARSVL
jgi:hypothetical protein